MATSKGSVPVTKTQHCLCFLLPASNWVGTQARFLGWLVSHFEKRNICFYASILLLSILGPFQPFQMYFLITQASFSSSVKVSLLPFGFPFTLKSLSITQTKTGRTYLSCGTSKSCSNLADDAQEEARGMRTESQDHCGKWRMLSPHSLRRPSCPRGLWFPG